MMGRPSNILFPRSPLLSEFMDNDTRGSNAVDAIGYIDIALSIVKSTPTVRQRNPQVTETKEILSFGDRKLDTPDQYHEQ